MSLKCFEIYSRLGVEKLREVKMVKVAVFGLLLLFVSFCPNGNNALTCYECTIKDGKACYDPVDKDLIKAIDCRNSSFIIGHDDNRVFQCVYTLDRFRNNQTSILRKCAVKNSGSQEYCDVHNNDAVQQGFTVDACKSCTDDKCNSSSNITGNLPVLVATLIIGLKIRILTK